MLDYTYYAALTAAFFVAIFDWRRGLLLCVIFDVVRDPVRKLAEDQPVAITVAAAGLWVAAFVGASRALGPKLFIAVRQLPAFHNAVVCLLIGLTPAAVIATFSYPAGWQVAALGYTSYTLPLIGVAVGSQLLRKAPDLWRLLGLYCLINSVALTGTLFEFLDFKWPGLRGMRNMVWLRYEEGYTVELIAGYYRSPDVMGLHASNSAMFAALLSLRRRSRHRVLWIAVITWCSVCLILSGRRKMIGMLVVFVAVYVGMMLRNYGITRLLPFVLVTCGFIGGVFVVMQTQQETATYATYAQSTITHGSDRLRHNIIEGLEETFKRSGFMGAGLGTATQGRYYTDAQLGGARTFQEDGITRVVAEMGIFGAIFCVLAVANMVWAAYVALRMVPGESPIRELQTGMLAVIVANAASFAVSHQAYSGDPSSLLFVSLLLGVLYAGPIQLIREYVAKQRYAEYAMRGEDDVGTGLEAQRQT